MIPCKLVLAVRIRNRSDPCLLSFASFPLPLLHGEAPLRLLRLVKATVFLLLGLMMSGQVSAADPALEMYSEKATRGDAQAQYRLGVLLSSGAVIARDRQ